MKRNFVFVFVCSNLFAATIPVTMSTDPVGVPVPGTLRYALVTAANGDTIDCTAISGGAIHLTSSLPAIQHDLTILGSLANPVTILGNATDWQAFSVVNQGVNTSIRGFTVKDCVSLGGEGGPGRGFNSICGGGGGGGAGGGGAVYLHDGSSLTIGAFYFETNQAKGGVGGASTHTGSAGQICGGGGGGFGGGFGGGPTALMSGSGGGGGGNNNGGIGTAPSFNDAQFLGGGGGGSSDPGAGAAGGRANFDQMTMAYLYTGGTGALGGGGGAGAGGNGNSAIMLNGGSGGLGIGVDQTFGGGGGGGGGVMGGNGAGGRGVGTGGGGGGGGGGDGGQSGGGGGGSYGGSGGRGGFGAGGGGGISGGASLFGGGSGGSGGTDCSGGGGAGMGGAIYIGKNAYLTIEDLQTPFHMSPQFFSMNSAVGGAGGMNEMGMGGGAGTKFGDDLFIRTGGTLIFKNSNPITISSKIESDQGTFSGIGGLTVAGTGLVTLQGNPNTYVGPTSITSGTLSVSDDHNLGVLAYGINLGGGTLLASSGFSSARSVSLTGIIPSTIDVNMGTLNLSGTVSGTGALIKSGNGQLTLQGNNQFSELTINAGVVQGTVQSLARSMIAINTGSTLIFDQNSNAAYLGSLSGTGALIKQGTAELALLGISSFSGPTTLSVGILNIQGSLMNSSIAAAAITTLTGNGIAGSATIQGALNPTGTLRFNGPLTLTTTAQTIIGLVNDANDRIELVDPSADAQLAGSLIVNAQLNQFPGFSRVFTILETAKATGRIGIFSSLINNNTDPNITFSPIYLSNQVRIKMVVRDPFSYCDIKGENARSVADYLTFLNADEQLLADQELLTAFNSVETCSQVNEALEQLHPAQYSAFAEAQADAGSLMLSLFQRRPIPRCGCFEPRRFWLEPFGNWLEERNRGEQVGFKSMVRGGAFGVDGELGPSVVMGVGGVWNRGELHWQEERGHGRSEGYYGSFYLDYFNENNYLGTAFIGGFDYFDVTRRIAFAEQKAEAQFRAFDLMARLSAAHFFGSSLLAFFPYLNLDLYYLKQDSFTEHQAPGFDLKVEENQSSTLRTELGFTIQSQDRNKSGSMCVSPLISAAWVMEVPIQRKMYTSAFARIPGETFQVRGWEETWNNFLMRMGMNLNYRCFSVSADYTVEMFSKDFFSQKGDVRFEFSW